MFGPHSENLDNLQLLELEPSISLQEVEAEASREPLTTKSPTDTQATPRLPEVAGSSAPRCERDSLSRRKLDASDVIGHDESEQLDVETARQKSSGVFLAVR